MSGMIHWEDGDDEPERVKRIRFEGAPTEPDRPGERNRFTAFISALGIKRLRLGFGSAVAEVDRHSESDPEAARLHAEAAKLGAEAAEIHARTDNAVAQAIEVNGELRRIFADERTPFEVKMLEVARLMDADPRIGAQAERVREVCKRLSALHGLHVSMPEVAVSPEVGYTHASVPQSASPTEQGLKPRAPYPLVVRFSNPDISSKLSEHNDPPS